MRKSHTRLLGAVAALLAAGLAGFSLRPQSKPTAQLAARNPAADVRTEVIRRTIHIVRHQHAAHGRPPGAAPLSHAVGSGPAHSAGSIHTGASGSHGAGAGGSAYTGAGGAVVTRTSSHGVTGSAPSGTSGSGPVTTRTSSHGGTSSGSGPTTRSSGGGERERGDHGD